MELIRIEGKVLKIGIDLVDWLKSDEIVLKDWLAKIKLIKIGKTEADWIEIETDFLKTNLITDCLAGMELINLIKLLDLIG